MRKMVYWGLGIFLITGIFSQNIFAATVQGNAYLDGQADHSGITVTLISETPPPIPTTGIMGIGLLLGALSLGLARKRTRAVTIPVVLMVVTGLGCVVLALSRYSAVTDEFGAWDLTDVIEGNYLLTASKELYYPEERSVTVTAGVNTIPDITLYPMTTPTPAPTDTPTELPTITPTPFPTDTPTITPTNTPVIVSVGSMFPILAGTFSQGSPSGEPCRVSSGVQNEILFTHTLTRNLLVMETEISRTMWDDLKAVQPSLPDDPSWLPTSPTMDHPVQWVTWYEAVFFANLLSLQNGYKRCYYKDAAFTIPVDETNYLDLTNVFYCDFDASGYRLPSEGEWEYFARAGTTGPFSTDEPSYNGTNCTSCSPDPSLDVLDSIAWWCGNAANTAHPIGKKLPNQWNLKDVHGNVREWCWDWLANYPAGPETDYAGPASGSIRALRGGCFLRSSKLCRSAFRDFGSPTIRSDLLGFRLVQTVF
jgi:formylglycine-generating enzyme required for sulfatase activity